MTNALYVNLDKKKIYVNEFEYKSLNKSDLVFTASKLVGYGIVGLNRIKIYTDSQETTCGGYFAHQLRCNGYEHIVISGQSEKPVYIYINKDEVVLKDATNLWGKEPEIVRDTIYKELSSEDIEVAQIGIGSEVGLDFSKILMGKSRNCGKNGIGKIMGEKKLKAISLQNQETLKSKNEKELNKINKKISEAISQKELSNNFDDNNSCYGCCVGCESTSIKKISKYLINFKECKEVDKICNNYVIDSVSTSKLISEYRKIEENLNIDYFIKDVLYTQKYNRLASNMKNQNKKKQEKNSLHKELEELGFCKFLIDGEILTTKELQKLKEITL